MKPHLRESELRDILRLIEHANEAQAQLITEALRLKAERTFEDPPEPPAAAPVGARIPRNPPSGAPGAAAVADYERELVAADIDGHRVGWHG